MQQWTMSIPGFNINEATDILLKKDNMLYCCETIQDAEIISEESLG